MNRWFSRFLYDVPNGVEQDAPAWVAREGASRLEPTPYASWPVPGSRPVRMGLSGDGATVGDLRVLSGGDDVQALVDDARTRALALASSTGSESRLLFRSSELQVPVHLSGEPQVTVALSTDRPAVNLSAALVSTMPTGTTRILTRGFADPQNAEDLDGPGTPLVPGEQVEVSFTYEPVDVVVPAGSTLSVMVYSSDQEFTIRPAPGSVLEVDLAGTSTSLPVVGGPLAMARATDDVPGYATALVADAARTGQLSRQNEQQLGSGLARILSFAAEGKTHQAQQHLTQFADAARRVQDPLLRSDLLELAEELGDQLADGRLG